jgi:hypothetical protein
MRDFRQRRRNTSHRPGLEALSVAGCLTSVQEHGAQAKQRLAAFRIGRHGSVVA